MGCVMLAPFVTFILVAGFRAIGWRFLPALAIFSGTFVWLYVAMCLIDGLPITSH
jgi:hypothetical protein